MFMNQTLEKIWSCDDEGAKPWSKFNSGWPCMVDTSVPPPQYSPSVCSSVPTPLSQFYGYVEEQDRRMPQQMSPSPEPSPPIGFRKITKSNAAPESTATTTPSMSVYRAPSRGGSISSSGYGSASSQPRSQTSSESERSCSPINLTQFPERFEWAEEIHHRLMRMNLDSSQHNTPKLPPMNRPTNRLPIRQNLNRYATSRGGGGAEAGAKGRQMMGQASVRFSHGWTPPSPHVRNVQFVNIGMKQFMGGSVLEGRRLRCEFCLNNARWTAEQKGRIFNERSPYAKWNNHRCKDPVTGDIVCPVLMAKICPECGASGAKAHTLRYCPTKKAKALDAQLKSKKIIG